MMAENECKPQIDYPCAWVYKVIGRDGDHLRNAIAEVLVGTAHTVTPSRSSKRGAYHCLNVATTVATERARLDLYERLRSQAAVIMVM
jgi:putative lipoic acid-binding regulatory protein